METLPQATTSSNYSAACTLVDTSARTVKYKVANASVLAQVMAANPHGGDGSWGQEFLVTPEDNTYDNAIGIRFRDAIAGEHAIVVAQTFGEGDPVPSAGVPFTARVDASGRFSTGGSVITGQVNADGSKAAGTGFTSIRTGVGLYTITFDTPFSAPPDVQAQTISYPMDMSIGIELPTTNGFRVSLNWANAGPGDRPFNFTAQAFT